MEKLERIESRLKLRDVRIFLSVLQTGSILARPPIALSSPA
jgi:hypothetical protein